jgi:GAF domain-containing protein
METTETSRERRMITAFVELADTLVDDYDIIDLLDRLTGHCVDLLAADAAGILLADAQDDLRVVASTNEQTEWMELMQLQSDEGPCLDCVRTGTAVSIADLDEAAERWPRFTAALADRESYRSVHALPLQLRGRPIGALNLFHREPGLLPAADLNLAQALADVATIGILSERSINRGEIVNEQLQFALNNRVIIEQAKGVLGERGSISLDAAYERMRSYAREHHLKLGEIAREIVESDLGAAVLAGLTEREAAPRQTQT